MEYLNIRAHTTLRFPLLQLWHSHSHHFDISTLSTLTFPLSQLWYFPSHNSDIPTLIIQIFPLSQLRYAHSQVDLGMDRQDGFWAGTGQDEEMTLKRTLREMYEMLSIGLGETAFVRDRVNERQYWWDRIDDRWVDDRWLVRFGERSLGSRIQRLMAGQNRS